MKSLKPNFKRSKFEVARVRNNICKKALQDSVFCSILKNVKDFYEIISDKVTQVHFKDLRSLCTLEEASVGSLCLFYSLYYSTSWVQRVI